MTPCEAEVTTTSYAENIRLSRKGIRTQEWLLRSSRYARAASLLSLCSSCFAPLAMLELLRSSRYARAASLLSPSTFSLIIRRYRSMSVWRTYLIELRPSRSTFLFFRYTLQPDCTRFSSKLRFFKE